PERRGRLHREADSGQPQILWLQGLAQHDQTRKESALKAQGRYTVAKWEEAPYHQISENSRLTRASVAYQFTGEIEGTGHVEYLMFYSHFDPKDQHNSAAVYVGLIRFEGEL